MARPKSEDKRDALFIYFETKADLFNQLYLELKAGMAAASLDGLPVKAPLREQFSRG
jgi:hypothetical protein